VSLGHSLPKQDGDVVGEPAKRFRHLALSRNVLGFPTVLMPSCVAGSARTLPFVSLISFLHLLSQQYGGANRELLCRKFKSGAQAPHSIMLWENES
jgi:hypothetical protein